MLAAKPSSIVALLRRVDPSIREDTIDPAFQDGGHSVPPDGVLQNDQVCPFELLDLLLDVATDGALLKYISLFCLRSKPSRILADVEMALRLDRIESQLVEIGDLH